MICRYSYTHVYMRCIPYVHECVHVRMYAWYYVSSKVLIFKSTFIMFFSFKIIELSETLMELPNRHPFLNPQSFGLCGPGSRIQS